MPADFAFVRRGDVRVDVAFAALRIAQRLLPPDSFLDYP
jgi:hypothetical protein